MEGNLNQKRSAKALRFFEADDHAGYPLANLRMLRVHRFKESVQKTFAGVDTRVVSYNFSKGLGLGAGFEMGRVGGHQQISKLTNSAVNSVILCRD